MNGARPMMVVAALLALQGCERTFRDMYDQPRYKPLAASPLWPDGRSSRPAVDGAVGHSEGTAAGASSGRLGAIAPAPHVDPLDTVRDTLRPKSNAAAQIQLPAITATLLDRGRNRFDIFCAPCHGVVGDGDGIVARRGFPHPPSFHTDALRTASDTHLYAVITSGYGAMYSYATRIEPADRLAIVAYVRALQLSQHAMLAQLSDEQRARLTPSQPSGSAPSGERR